MKILIGVVLSIHAGHFRAIGFNVIQDLEFGTGELSVSRTQAWRRWYAGYGEEIGCTHDDVVAQTVSNNAETQAGNETCTYQSTGESCGTLVSNYIVTDVEDTQGDPNDYCYGYKREIFHKPSGPYTIKWESCCWVALTPDTGIPGRKAGAYGFTARFNDPDNNAPQVKLPPMWKIMSGCPGQTLDLSPVDLDGDKIKCRFANEEEARGAYKGDSYDSLTINEHSCILTYDGSLDATSEGVKPIAVQIEDFDQAGNLLSSVPVQFLAAVWTPTNRKQAIAGSKGRGDSQPFIYQPFFGPDVHDHSTRHRRAGSIPSYCGDMPLLLPPTPKGGSIIFAPMSGMEIMLKAKSKHASITRFDYNSPLGMTCQPVNARGEASCKFTPTISQKGQVHNFCFIAVDDVGYTTERRCVILNADSVIPLLNAPTPPTTTRQQKPTTTLPPVVDVFSMMNFMIPKKQNAFEGYGCCGAGNMDHNTKNFGLPVDDVDRSLNSRKRCIRCVVKTFQMEYTTYTYNQKTNRCGDKMGTAQKAFCECDLQFVNTVGKVNPKFKQYKNSKCKLVIVNRVGNAECCEAKNGLFHYYNDAMSECCNGEIIPFGTC